MSRARRWVHEPPAMTGEPDCATILDLSDAEDIALTGLALDVGREISAFLGKIALAMIALGEAVIGDVEDPAWLAGEVRQRAVRHVAVEKYDVAGSSGQRLER